MKQIQLIGNFPQADFNQNDPTKSDYIKNKPQEMTIEDIDLMIDSNRIVDFGNLLFTEYGPYFDIELDLQEGYEDSKVKDYGIQTLSFTPTLKDGTIYTVSNKNKIYPTDYGINKKVELVHNSAVIDDSYYNLRDYYKTKVINGKATDFGMSEEKFAAYKTLVRDMLEYGAALQVGLNLNVDNLANENLAKDSTVFIPISEDILEKCYKLYANDNEQPIDGNEITFVFINFSYIHTLCVLIPCALGNTDGFTVTVTDLDGNVTTYNLANLKKYDSTSYYISIPTPLNKFDEPFTVELAKDNVWFQKLVQSMADYIDAIVTAPEVSDVEAEVYRRLYVYGKSYENFINTP